MSKKNFEILEKLFEETGMVSEFETYKDYREVLNLLYESPEFFELAFPHKKYTRLRKSWIEHQSSPK
jgi:hypothetical protein